MGTAPFGPALLSPAPSTPTLFMAIRPMALTPTVVMRKSATGTTRCAIASVRKRRPSIGGVPALSPSSRNPSAHAPIPR